MRPSVIDDFGMPVSSYPLYRTESKVSDFEMTRACPGGAPSSYDAACGDWVVNTAQPSSPPYNTTNANARFMPLIDDDVYPNIGDRLSDAGISWAWYAGGWDQVNSDPSKVPQFQFHHQPFLYFEDYAPGTPGRAHLRDSEEFVAAAKAGALPTVSFVKPYASENEHPGYASEPLGSANLVELVRAVVEGGSAGNTLVVVTYDEFGGQWDHVSPPTGDAWGPGTRIPAMVIGRSLTRSGVDHTRYDTTSILATIERSFGLEPLGTRDASVNDLAAAVAAGGR
ncbi:alkaline phosphatase family protein [Nocardioides marmoribigeumensis]|uniref:Acid phosphatase n=1 Tax=Nocardioides marmoribigeumensis TaxID=433649 RepID=A0ABU2BSL7_9ACTN|nr:acid phosphatase [Nocardioides marmoribigeumensis]